MATKIGPFEILSELAKSPTGSVYKATDPETGQTIALKAIRLSAFGESAVALEQALMAEAESTRVLSSPNITSVYGAGEIEGQFCAAMDYIQGNSIATMLARKEGFSIWDLLDIGRQLASGLDHATSHNVVHYSLEPGKIMCGWDGTVKLLGFGVSASGNFVQHVSDGLPATLRYMSPEQIQGQPMDGRSNLFTLGAMFYEMVTERKAFDGEDAESLRRSILSSMPVAPIQVNPKVHPLLSDLILKALAKDPAERYASGRALLDDLEKCKESKPVAAKKPMVTPKGPAVPDGVKAVAQSKFVGAKPATATPGLGKPAAKSPAASPSGLARASVPATPDARTPQAKLPLAKPAEKKISTPAASTEVRSSALGGPASKLAAPKAAAAAAGAGSSDMQRSEEFDLDLSDQVGTSSGKPPIESEAPSAFMSAAAADEPQVETFEPQADNAPTIKVDPMMAEDGGARAPGASFSDLDELPPLKEVYIAPPPPPPPPTFEPVAQAPTAPTMFRGTLKRDEKPKVQPREVAEKAIKEIKNVPRQLMLYAIGGALALILVIGIGFTIYVHNLSSEDDSGAGRTSVPAETPAPSEASQPASTPAPKPVAPPAAPVQPEQTAEQTSEPAAREPQPVASSRSPHSKKRAPAPPPMIIPGQLAVDSTPQGAQVQIDGRTESTWVTPFAFSNLLPGQHSITVSKAGYSTDTRTVTATSGNRVTIIAHLSQLMATLVVKSNPPGANIYVDGRDVGARTPAQVSVDKGQHVVLVRMMGYLDETMNGQFVLGQTLSFTPTLRPLANADNIRTVGGKMSKLFGGKGAQPGQATVSIRTQPKGAQVAINQHLMEKNTPMDVALDSGNYVIDITMTGYAPVHKVITTDKGDKLVVDEALQPQ